MLKNYLTIALRTLRRHTGYTVVNVFGLAFGLACCLLIGLFVYDEFSYDDFHEDADRLYFVGKDHAFGGAREEGMSTQLPLARAMEREIAGVEAVATTTYASEGSILRPEAGQEADARILFADSTFLELFTFPLVHGDAGEALDAPNTVVLTQRLARQLFGDADPVGQAVEIPRYADEPLVYTVTGVLAPPPSNSYFQFEALAALSTLRETRLSSGWGGSMYLTFARLGEGVQPAAVEAGLVDVVRTHMGEGEVDETRYFLVPMTDLYLSALTQDDGFKGSRRYVRLFVSIALFILLVAIVNYMNLATARTAQRVREVGVRKTIGASRAQVMRQFLAEAVLVTGIAFALAVALAQLALPVFNTVFGKSLSLADALEPPLALLAVALLLATGLAAGSYPALYLSHFRPARILRREAGGRGGAAWLRKGLVVLQFGITVVLLVATATVYQQLRYTQTKDLGFAGEQVLSLAFADNAMAFQHAAVKQAVLRHPGVLSASATNSVPGSYAMRYGFHPDTTDHDRQVTFYSVLGDHDYLKTLGLALTAGRAFDPDRPSDATEAILVNERGAAVLNRTPVVGTSLGAFSGGRNEVIGIIEDYHFASLRESIEPVLLRVREPREQPWPPYYHLMVRFQPERAADVVAHIQAVWKEFGATEPPEVAFLDDAFAAMYATERRLGQVFGVFAVVAIVIACLGLFGLAAYAAEQRTKEIGIRKILGASVPGLVGLLSREFLVLVATAFAVAVPLAYLLMSRWLENFAYRTDLGAGVFVLAGVLALALALATVGYQAVRVAHRNPVDALRYE